MDEHPIVGCCVVAKNKGIYPESDKEELVRGGVLTEDGRSVVIADGYVGWSLGEGEVEDEEGQESKLAEMHGG
jgi:hypothetical protein